MPNARRYLPDIDGLRALAVMAVVLFHLDVPGLDGGYVGVDIFFVISGFLISGILVDRINGDTLRFSEFYSSRIRRLLPAVLATVAATAIAAVLLLQPLELQSFGRSALAAIFSAANFVFYVESGYWDSDSALKPLLHMWSLGVEEQFYLFWPALVWLFIKIGGHRGFVISMCLLLVLSLWASITYTTSDQPAAFFLLPFRVWQFCLGALAMVLWRRQKVSICGQQLLRSAGLALCCVAIATFADGSQFPGWLALIPSIGAAMVLIGASATDPSPILANSLARWLGRVSYSMYLVHWPPIALYLSVTQHGITDAARLGLGALTLVLTVLLHYGVESRFYRRGEHRTGHWGGAITGLLVASALLGICMTALWQYPDIVTILKRGTN